MEYAVYVISAYTIFWISIISLAIYVIIEKMKRN
jgi:hypothetical protein